MVKLVSCQKKIHLETNAISVRIYTFQTVQLGGIIDAKHCDHGIYPIGLPDFTKPAKLSELITRQVSKLVHSYLKPSLLARSAAETWFGRDLRAKYALPW